MQEMWVRYLGREDPGGNNNLSMDKLIKVGNKGLVQAAEKFDENRGFKFICYAIWWIRQSIENEISNSNNLQ